MNKMEHHNCETTPEMGIFKSNGSFFNFHPNLPKTSFIQKMKKINPILETSTF